MFDAIQAIIEGGTAGVAVLALIVLYLLCNSRDKIVANHFVHFAELLGQIGEKLDRVVDAIERNGDRRGRTD